MNCANCGRTLVPNRSPSHRWAGHLPWRAWLHRAEDFDPKKPIDCFSPQPDRGGMESLDG